MLKISTIPSYVALFAFASVLDLSVGLSGIQVSDLGVIFAALMVPLLLSLDHVASKSVLKEYAYYGAPFFVYMLLIALSEVISPGGGGSYIVKQLLVLSCGFSIALSYRSLLDTERGITYLVLGFIILFFYSVFEYFSIAGIGVRNALSMAAKSEALELRAVFGRGYRTGAEDILGEISVQRNRSAARATLLFYFGLSVLALYGQKYRFLAYVCLGISAFGFMLFPSRFYVLVVILALASAIFFSLNFLFKKHSSKTWILSLLVIFLICLVGAGIYHKMGEYIMSALTFQDASAKSRLSQLEEVLAVTRNLPLIGEGVSDWRGLAFHNILAASLYQAGVPGFLVILGLFSSMFYLYVSLLYRTGAMRISASKKFVLYALSFAPIMICLRVLTGGAAGAVPSLGDVYVLSIAIATLTKVFEITDPSRID